MSRSAVAAVLRSHHTPSPARRATKTGAVETGLRVLLVDAEIDRLLPLADALHRAGLVASIATSTDEAFFDIEASPLDVVVLDGEMADAPLLARLRAVPSMLPIVLMTTAPAPATAPRLAALLAIADVTWLQRPVEAQTLLELLSDASRFPRRSAASAAPCGPRDD